MHQTATKYTKSLWTAKERLPLKNRTKTKTQIQKIARASPAKSFCIFCTQHEKNLKMNGDLTFVKKTIACKCCCPWCFSISLSMIRAIRVPGHPWTIGVQVKAQTSKEESRMFNGFKLEHRKRGKPIQNIIFIPSMPFLRGARITKMMTIHKWSNTSSPHQTSIFHPNLHRS